MSKFDVAGDGIPKAHGRIFKMDLWPVDKKSEHLVTDNMTKWLYIILNYEIREDEVKKLEKIEGVDTARKCGKYKISITIGDLFRDTKVIAEVTSMITKITDDHDKFIDPDVLPDTMDDAIDRRIRRLNEERAALEAERNSLRVTPAIDTQAMQRDLRMRQLAEFWQMMGRPEADENGLRDREVRQDDAIRQMLVDPPTQPLYGDIGHYDGSQGPR